MRRLVGIALGVAVLALPQSAAAANAIHEVDTFLTGQVPNADGYVLDVYGTHHRVGIAASSGNAGTTYRARGVATAKRLSADFGQFGSVDLTFTPHGQARHPHVPGVPTGCEESVTVRPGVLSGTFSFRDRLGTTTVDATKVPAKTVTNEFSCEAGPPVAIAGHDHPHQANHRAVFLDAANSQGDYGTRFDATQLIEKGTTYFDASVSERIDGVRLDSFIGARAPKATFTYDVHRRLASVTPPPPFSGSAQLGRASSGVPTWTGDLAVDLPGYGTTPLTGDSFQASLARGVALILHSRASFRPFAPSRSSVFSPR